MWGGGRGEGCVWGGGRGVCGVGGGVMEGAGVVKASYR